MTKSVMVIGAGVVGLACSRALAMAGYDVVIVEKHAQIGTEVSGRNSGVIHAGIYYPQGSAKARFCLRGKQLMYQYCADHDIPHRNTQKLIVATNSAQDEILQKLQKTAAQNGVTLDLISGAQAMALEPELYATSALVSATTGIVDVHGLLFSLLAEAEAMGAVLSTQTCVSQILRTPQGLRVTGDSMGAAFDMSVDMVVNAAGLGAPQLAATYWPDAPKPPALFAKGNYFSIAGSLPFQRLIYPVPEQDGLGIHYTLDLNGQSRLGPNVRWIDTPNYDVDVDAEDLFRDAVKSYWPNVQDRTLSPDYVGIRPKIEGGDFVMRRDDRIITLLGIESPGLTSSLAIAEHVTALAQA